MKYRSRIYYSAEQKNLMWDRWQAGVSLNEIARLFDWGHSSVQGVLSETGGIRPCDRGVHLQTDVSPEIAHAPENAFNA